MELNVTVVGPYKAHNSSLYYSGDDELSDRSRQLAAWAIQEADDEIDFAEYDNNNDGFIDGFHFIFAGFGAEAGVSGSIWSHKWNFESVLSLDGKYIDTYSCSPELRGSMGSNITSIGVVCHEMCHAFSSPDYYDTNYAEGGVFVGTGNWDLMAGGSWNGSPNGSQPAMINMYQKVKFKWVNPTELNSPKTIFNMTNSADSPIEYIIKTKTNGEYFLIENRQKVGYDMLIPGHGLIIYRVTENGYVNNRTHPQNVYPVCANSNELTPNDDPRSYGDINSAGCPFPGSSFNQSFTDETTPSTISWSGNATGKPITNIVEDAASKTINFDFMGGGSSNCGDEPINLVGKFNADERIVELSWEAPESDLIPTSYRVYMRSLLIATGIKDTKFTDRDVLSKGQYGFP